MYIRDNYEKNIESYNKKIIKLNSKIANISRLRLIVMLLLISLAIVTFDYKYYLAMAFTIISLGAVFAYLVFKHHQYKGNKKYLQMLSEVNTETIQRMSGEWKEFSDMGSEFIDQNHEYSYDLDIFGKGSLFQYINSTNTKEGRQVLANMLTKYCTTANKIINRQSAIKELAEKKWWRLKLQALGKMYPERDTDINYFNKWTNTEAGVYDKTWLKVGILALPISTFMSIILASFNTISVDIPTALLVLQFAILVMNIGKRNQEFKAIFKYKDSIKSYRHIVELIEESNFKSSELKALQLKLKHKNSISASMRLKKLESLVNRIGDRNNQAFFLINVLTLWDYHCMVSLQKFKASNSKMLIEYIDVIANIEALCSLANLASDTKGYSFPIITTEKIIKANSIAHPLLFNNRIANNIELKDNEILLITGSNMSGKSTFLRTIGLNLVLAYIGAPVCAESFHCPILKVNTCMRISDDLNKGLSSFYAELLRIKEIVDEASKHSNVFFLLDEIFKGTNSYDRHIGATRLINKLKKCGAVGLVSTHDLELAEMEDSEIITNYHFQEHYKNNKILFDYKLKNGVSTTRNALQLMKIIGID